MKTLFALASVMVVLFLTAPNKIEAQKQKAARIIEGTISDYECGDNCYLTIIDKTGKQHVGLCTAHPLCTKWNREVIMPAIYKGKRVKVTLGKGTLLTGSGDVVGTMDAFTKIQFVTETQSLESPKSKQTKSILPEITNVRMPEALGRQMARDDNGKVKSCQMCGQGGDDDAKWFVEVVTTRSVDLNEDANPEWIMSMCGNHTCSGWIYREVAGKYVMIFAGYMGDVSEVTPLRTLSNGYRDLIHDSGSYAMILKYDGRRYKRTECLEYKPTYNGQAEMLSRKLVRRGPCPK